MKFFIQTKTLSSILRKNLKFYHDHRSDWTIIDSIIESFEKCRNPSNLNHCPSPRSIMTKPAYSLFCMGNPLLDMQVTNGEDLLQKYGLKADDAILAEEKHAGM